MKRGRIMNDICERSGLPLRFRPTNLGQTIRRKLTREVAALHGVTDARRWLWLVWPRLGADDDLTRLQTTVLVWWPVRDSDPRSREEEEK